MNIDIQLLEQKVTVLQKDLQEVQKQLEIVSRTLGVSLTVMLKRIQLLEGTSTEEVDKLATENGVVQK